MRQRQAPKPKCADCGSEDLKKRKNFSHGSGSKGKVSYSCNACGSTKVAKEQQRRGRR